MDKPQTIYRSDYTPPDFLVERLDLFFDIKEEETLCRAEMLVRRNPATDRAPTFSLNGDDLTLISIRIDGQPLTEDECTLDDAYLTLTIPADKHSFTLTIETLLKPAENTQLQGLYEAEGILCTKCETEGFRRITFYPDRPDVMAVYHVRIEADKERYPVLLSNGNRGEAGDLPNGRHYANWHDPNPKPSYLFALVAGKLDRVKGRFTTQEGRDVELNVWVESGKGNAASYALSCLQKAMRWDEKTFNRTYDLEQFSIVAVRNFNSGACENTSLNIFNDKYILAAPETTTDKEYADIEAVIGHEFFHHWSGNRVTLADWFNLSLKEGLTVYRDQIFSADMRQEALQRIEDVARLRLTQFPEDAGSMAHPVRPESYISVRNVYTGTVYNKGAEVIRMMEKVIGRQSFRKAVSAYFDRYAGQAVTCDDFVGTLQEVSGVDLGQFLQSWYRQAGTPHVEAVGSYDPEDERFTLTLKQSVEERLQGTPHHPFIIPLEIGLLDQGGEDMPLSLSKGEMAKDGRPVLLMRKDEEIVVFENLPEEPVLSLNRDFSAPVTLSYPYEGADRALLMRHDSDFFNRWDAGQRYLTDSILALTRGEAECLPKDLLDAFSSSFASDLDPFLAAKMLTVPILRLLSGQMDILEPEKLFHARQEAVQQIASRYEADFRAIADRPLPAFEANFDGAGKRALCLIAYAYLAALEEKDILLSAYKEADNMTMEEGCFKLIVHSDWAERNEVVADFYERHQDNHLLVDKWFLLQAMAPQREALAWVKELTAHPAFDLTNPNSARALIGGFVNNLRAFHAENGEGYAFLTEQVAALDPINPQVAAILLKPLGNWQKHTPTRQKQMLTALEELMGRTSLSPNSYEVAKKALDLATKK